MLWESWVTDQTVGWCIVLSKCVYSMLLGDRGFTTGFGDRYLMQNMDWLQEELGGFDDDYLVFDCPGEISFTNFTIVFYSHRRRRANRTIHAPSISTQFSAKLDTNGHSHECGLLGRISIYGGPLQVFWVCIVFCHDLLAMFILLCFQRSTVCYVSDGQS